jgi:membrane-bound lytic murein transglycosylase MltF
MRARTIVLAVVVAVTLARCGDSGETRVTPAAPPAPAATAGPAADPADPPSLDPASANAHALAQPWVGDLDGMVRRRYIRVLVVPDKMQLFFDGSRTRGATHDAMREFESFLNQKLNTPMTPVGIILMPTRRDEILRALADGRGDIAAGNLGISAERQAIVDFSDPVRDRIKVIPVGGLRAAPLASLDDLAGRTLYIPASSAMLTIVADLNRRFRAEGRPEIVVSPADENLDTADIYEMVNAGLVELTLGDSLTAAFWSKVFGDLHPYPDLPLVDAGATGWAFRKHSPQLSAVVNEFIAGHREGTAFGNTILRRYLSNTSWVKHATGEEEVARFKTMVDLFRKYGDEVDLPYLLVAAQAFQESGLDQTRRSPVGAVGVLQIKPSTAAGKPIEVDSVDQLENNIKAGTRYLRFLVDQYYKDEPMDRVTRGLFAIASYNAGPARIRQLRQKAEAQGLDPNRWFNNVEQVAAKEIGRETVQYVSNIYKYYLAYTMVTENAARAESLKATPRRSSR